MTRPYSITIDCAEPNLLASFWVEALGYRVESPPAGYDSWKAYWMAAGLPEDEVPEGADSIEDPEGRYPTIWFQVVPEGKEIKNRMHLDLRVTGGRAMPLAERRALVDAEAARLVALGARLVRIADTPAIEHYAACMQDPEGNEFDLH